MSIKDILAKAARGEELSEDERATLVDFDPTDVASRRVKDVQDKSAKELAALKAKAEELQAALDERESASLTEAEKLKRDAAKAQKDLAAAKAEAEAARKESASTARNYALESVLGGIKWVDDSARNAGRILLQQSLADIDDLTDAAAVKPAVDAARESVLSRLIAADGVNGTGLHPNNQTPRGPQKAEEAFTYKPGMWDGMSAADTRKKLDELWRQHGNAPSPEVGSGRAKMTADKA